MSSGHNVTLSDLQKYKAEPVTYGRQISEITRKIIGNYRPASGDGWVISTKTDLRRTGDGHNECVRYKFVLHTDGTIKVYSLTQRDGKSSGIWKPVDGTGGNGEYILAETDFAALGSGTETTAQVTTLMKGKKSGDGGEYGIECMNRRGSQKGQGLYDCLSRLEKRLSGQGMPAGGAVNDVPDGFFTGGTADADSSRLFRALREMPSLGVEELYQRVSGAMVPVVVEFMRNHPDHYLTDELIGKVGPDGIDKEAIDAINDSAAELMQLAEDDSLNGNDRSALYILAFGMGMRENSGSDSAALQNELLDRVLRLENSGEDVSADLSTWPLLASMNGFMDWHDAKYGVNGTSGGFDMSDPLLDRESAFLTGRKAAPVMIDKEDDGPAGIIFTPHTGGARDELSDLEDFISGDDDMQGGSGRKGRGRTTGRIILVIAAIIILLAGAFAAYKIISGRQDDGKKSEHADDKESREDKDKGGDKEDADDEKTEDDDQEQGMTPVDRVYAHRGTGGEEETFGSYDSAIDEGATRLEQDVILSDSGDLYVSYRELSDDELRSQGKLKLADVFERYGTSVIYVVELKTRTEAAVNALADLAEEKGVSANVEVQCFDSSILKSADSALPEARMIYLVDDKHGGQDALDDALDKGYIDAIFVSRDDGLMTLSNCDKVHGAGKYFGAWVLDDESAVREAMSVGVDMYFTRKPGMAIRVEEEERQAD